MLSVIIPVMLTFDLRSRLVIFASSPGRLGTVTRNWVTVWGIIRASQVWSQARWARSSALDRTMTTM